MTLKLWRSIGLLVVVMTFASSFANAQVHGRNLWITVRDDFAVLDTGQLVFGNWPAATFGIDSLTPSCKEVSGPPLPPSFDTRFSNIPLRVNIWGLGLLKFDVRSLTSVTGADTFVIQCYNGDNLALNTNYTLNWGSPAFLTGRCDSAFLVDPTGIVMSPARVNMFTQQSLQVLDPGTTLGSSSFKLRIFVYGSRYPDTIPGIPTSIDFRMDNPSVPQSFALHQNYPNPFNPTTTISFDVQKLSLANISIYNILGQKVATLYTGQLMPGSYSTVWNGTADNGMTLPSGVYFVRMSARSEHGQQFTGLRKLLFMK